MRDSLYVALSSQIALERRLDTIADNVANASTIGFRATGVKFEDVVSGTGQKSVSFASPGKTYLSGAHGALSETGNPFDFAVQGDAWFAIETPVGTVMTRDGRFSMNENGELMSIEGHPVLDAGGSPIQLDPRNGPPKVGADGSLRQNDQLVGSIGLYNFDPGPNFVRYGNSGIVPTRTPEPVTDRSDIGVAQGFLEESNVNPVLEITRLIMVQRAFENTAALMRQTDSSTDEAIKTLGSK
ncbi:MULTISPECIES: flagellar basal-body rod protein FlgF [unclassified Mesorhizobium]|uniref:flagellar basal-body rod protein FlgF n=2 Tax=Mesorhizobium TaxID=68287 RepID=UPI000FCAC871|nr:MULTISPECIES: flagellar basal-body rod protein FlgF [unclassified Mesorhizobium]RUU59165.1 flagellar basal-body rod protein FlgF [Mesorhizobium sp. M7A.T.Ca.TU.009.01.1.1]RUU86497.1 flagellar basal-body rod protein FlgF [Mesorhizobium sp. M7A.T.Ca.TU.009.01.1.2]RWO45405.1 MAG: flagellar basal-body rod protein FlgF [Mesorhizobium sp.]RUT81560.1 flagellar basal-body rod protein FlgF [Mesorhizobium sp. M7A.T.Ca.US.000.02.1.1]RUT92544.1 flagellar basal-body rod protein FlgF [Mesorhizobium sp. M